jgi:hypothetical protein
MRILWLTTVLVPLLLTACDRAGGQKIPVTIQNQSSSDALNVRVAIDEAAQTLPLKKGEIVTTTLTRMQKYKDSSIHVQVTREGNALYDGSVGYIDSFSKGVTLSICDSAPTEEPFALTIKVVADER